MHTSYQKLNSGWGEFFMNVVKNSSSSFIIFSISLVTFTKVLFQILGHLVTKNQKWLFQIQNYSIMHACGLVLNILHCTIFCSFLLNFVQRKNMKKSICFVFLLHEPLSTWAPCTILQYMNMCRTQHTSYCTSNLNQQVKYAKKLVHNDTNNLKCAFPYVRRIGSIFSKCFNFLLVFSMKNLYAKSEQIDGFRILQLFHSVDINKM